MNERSGVIRVIACVLLLVLAVTVAAAQSDDSKSDDKASAAGSGDGSKKGSEVVYTTDYLKERFEKSDTSPPTVFTNSDLEPEAEQAEPPPGAAYTNDDLKERFGNEGAPAAEGDTGDAEPAVDDAAAKTDLENGADPPAKPEMSDAERDAHIAVIDGELEQLEKRLLAIRNPLLAGTAPPSAAEAPGGETVDNAERLRRTEAKIDELKKALEELRAGRPDVD